VSYVVQSGDVLSAIAVSHGSTVKAVVELNGLADANAIHEGQVLQVPAASPAPAASELPAPTATLKHEVRPGETLSHIADGYGVTVQALVEANSLATADAIVVGQVLLVPGQAAPAPATVAVRTPTRTHTVLAGETLSMIAEHYGFSAQELAALNGLSDAGLIVEGEPLLIPAGPPPPGHAPGRRHTVSAGETLAEIAAQYRVAVDAIVDANGLASPDLLVVGQYLTIPASGSRQKLPRAEYDRVLAAAADEFGISRALVKAVAWQESGWNQDIVSHANAYGLMQIIPSTAQWALETLVHDAPNWDISHIDNARMGAAILRDHLIRTDWDVSIALAAYYQGFEALRKVGMYEDTKEYVASISALIPQFE
jgi:LysM repeat protein